MTVGLLSYNIGAPVGGAGTLPLNLSLPTVTGSAIVDQTLSSTPGTWSGTPTPTQTYQWQRGVPDVAPSNTVLPVVTGKAAVGSTLTTTNGTWLGTPTPTLTRQWESGGSPVGTGGLTYVPVAGDIGKSIACRVTATNLMGTVNATSLPVGPVTDAVPTTVYDTNSGTFSGVAFSNGNLTIKSIVNGGYQSARSVKSRTTGKVYCEITQNVSDVGYQTGLTNAAESLVYPIGVYDNDGIGSTNSGEVWMNGANPPNSPVSPAWLAGHTRRIAVDFDNKLIWFATDNGFWNNATGADPTNPAPAGKGISFVTMNAGPYFLKTTFTGTVDTQATANFGGTPYLFSAPAGYGDW